MYALGGQLRIVSNNEPLSIEHLWEIAGFKPNDQQREAILHVDGPLYLPAGPGSGKTRVLLWRTLNLIVFYGVNPHEIYLSTFTKKAAHQLQQVIPEAFAASLSSGLQIRQQSPGRTAQVGVCQRGFHTTKHALGRDQKVDVIHFVTFGWVHAPSVACPCSTV